MNPLSFDLVPCGCVSAENLANGNFIAATIAGNNPVLINMWRWDAHPGNDLTTWSTPDCTVTIVDDVPLPNGNGLGVRVYAGLSSNSADQSLPRQSFSGGGSGGQKVSARPVKLREADSPEARFNWVKSVWGSPRRSLG